MPDLPLVVVLILNWNSEDMTYNCVLSLLHNTDYPKEKLKVIVIDNGSTDSSYYSLKRKLYPFRDYVIILRLTRNYYFIKGNNVGISYALEHFDPDYILLLNNDTRITQKDWLKKLVETAEGDDKIAIVGPKLVFPNGRIQWSARKRGKNTFSLILQTITARLNPGFGEPEEKAISANFIGEVNTISGACMLIRTTFIKKYGKLDTSLYPMYQEDVEYSFRAWKLGWKVVYRGDVKIVHYEGYTTKNQTSKQFNSKKFYWALRNSIIVSLRYIGVWKTITFGILIYLPVLFVNVRDRERSLYVSNLEISKNLKQRLILAMYAFKEAISRRREGGS